VPAGTRIESFCVSATPSDALPLSERGGVGDQQHLGRLAHRRLAQQPHGHLGADAARVAEQHGDAWDVADRHG
jgi:hypothetical protein